MSSKTRGENVFQIQQEYGDEEEYIQTVEDDIIDNKYSSTDSVIEEKPTVNNIGEVETFRIMKD
jgi:hypothetical protein